MLEFMRKQAKSWLMKTILVLIIVVFIGYFGYSRYDKQAQAVAEVEGKLISLAEYHKKYGDVYESYRRYLGGNVPEDLLKNINIKQQVLDGLINQNIVTNKAKELGIYASDDEIRESIISYPAFQRNGAFDPRVYRQVLSEFKMTPEDFERSQRDMITTSKLESLIKEGAQVSDRELYDIYALQNGKINLSFIKISPQDFMNRVKASDADLEKFLKDNGDLFRVPEKMQAQYLFFSADEFSNSVRIKDEDINEFYSFHKDRFAKEGEKELTPALKQKITSELKSTQALEIASKEAKNARDTIYQYDNMEEYAKKNRYTVHQTDFFTIKTPPSDLSGIEGIQQYLADLKKGDLSPILTTSKGLYLLKIVAVKSSYIPKLAEIRADVNSKYVEREARNLAGKEAQAVVDSLKKGENLDNVAKAKKLKTSETGFFVPSSNIPQIGESKDLAFSTLQLSEKKPYADNAFNVGGNSIVIKFKERAAIDVKDFEAKKADLKAGYLRIKGAAIFQSWLSGQRERLTQKGDMKIYKQASEL